MLHENQKSVGLSIISLAYSLLISCSSPNKQNVESSQDSLKSNLAIEKSFLLLTEGKDNSNDSSFLWADSSVEFAKCRITRIKDAGFYKYFFWRIDKGTPFIFLQDSIPIVEFISDTLFDVNDDKTKDLLVNGQFVNGQCPPKYSKVFCYSEDTNRFTQIPIASQIPNPKFFPSKKIVTGEIDCMMRRDIYKFRWVGLKLDTISIATISLN
jgi:hypothetical protein